MSAARPDEGRPRSIAGEPWLARSETRAVFAAVGAAGFTARAVGGAVRNSLLGRTVVDVDLATDAPPRAVMAAAQEAGLAAIPTGIAHGTVTLVSGGIPHEVTTLRTDVATDGRHATVAFTDDWAADASRRDFTVNALYCSADGEVFDPVGGYPDLVAGRVRFIGDARTRIREDYLRILRFFRFTADYASGPPDAEGLAACVQERDGLARLSAERVRQELLRLLTAVRGPELIGSLQGYGLLSCVLHAAPRLYVFRRLAEIEGALKLAPDAILRLAALAVAIKDDADQLRHHLRISNDEHARLVAIGHATRPDLAPPATEGADQIALYHQGRDTYRDRVLSEWACIGAGPDDAAWRARYMLPERWSPPRFPVTGDDVLALGVSPGPRVGRLLRELEAWWVARGFVADESELRAKLAALAAEPAN